MNDGTQMIAKVHSITTELHWRLHMVQLMCFLSPCLFVENPKKFYYHVVHCLIWLWFSTLNSWLIQNIL